MDEAIFCASSEPRDFRSGQPLSKILGEGPPQIRAPRLYSGDPAPFENALKPTHGGFDFRKFRHEIVIARNEVTKQSSGVSLDCFAPLAMTKRDG
jgi:hypothetical protein